ncbi:hypothetical protein [Oceanicella actignis]|uniref:hypothetical protein n=1 Tax=Oceanicella actignis TaxID=1189325 RepID=UPI001252C49F|nr:hypothetical protein [Oceanicella actignis]TYO85424.1 hypothetical protein LY05_02535 [Oceanicella actignis]
MRAVPPLLLAALLALLATALAPTGAALGRGRLSPRRPRDARRCGGLTRPARGSDAFRPAAALAAALASALAVGAAPAGAAAAELEARLRQDVPAGVCWHEGREYSPGAVVRRELPRGCTREGTRLLRMSSTLVCEAGPEGPRWRPLYEIPLKNVTREVGPDCEP